MFFNALLVAAVAFWYFNAVWMPQSGSPEFATKQRRAALRAYGLSVSSPSDSNHAFTIGNPLQLNFDLASAMPANSSVGFTLTRGTTTALNITTDVNCQTDTTGLSYTCQWFIPYSVNIGTGYSILVSVSNTAWVESTKAFAVTTRSNVVAYTLMQSEITTIQYTMPADKPYVTADLEVHREVKAPSYNVLEGPIFSIAQGVNVTGGGITYTWTVPVTLANTTDGYSIWIWAYTKAGDASTRTLVNVASGTVIQPLDLSGKYPGQSVTVAFPGSGDMWRTGTNDSISFDWKPAATWYTGFNADVYATDPANPLYYNPLRVLVNGDSSKRSFTFPVPKSIQQGNYFIYVWGFQGAASGVPMGGKGGVFLTYGAVAPSSASSILAVSAPAANNILYKGDQVNIQWSAGMVLTKLDIFLDYVTNTSSTNKATLASNITANTNTWKWVIPTTTESHKFYSIRVQGTQNAAQGSGVFTGVSYPITIMNRGESAGSLDSGESVNSDLAASSGTGAKKNGNGLNVGGGAQTLQTVSAVAGALLMLVTVTVTFF